MRIKLLFFLLAANLTAAEVAIRATVSTAPPDWAILERKLIDTMNAAAPVYLNAVAHRGGALRSHGKVDDDYECFRSWPLLYAIGGDEKLFHSALDEWNAITRYWTYEQRSVREEFVKHYDMLHTSEGYTGFQFFALADPAIPENVTRTRRFAGFYMNEDPEAPNYDPVHRIIRSPLTGSAGPLFHSEPRYMLEYGHASLYPLVKNLERGWYDHPSRRKQIEQLFDDVVLRGDVIMNLAVTGLITHAYLATDEEKYKRWVLDYTDGWMARIAENHGIIPDNIGPGGKIGENRQGQWWGGFFGWNGRYSLEMIFNSLITASECAYLVSGEPRYLDLVRSQVDMLLSHAITRGGDLLVPYKYGPKGWEDFRPLEPYVLSHLWHASMDSRDWQRIQKVRAGAKHGPSPYAYADTPNPPAPGSEAWRPDGSMADWKRVVRNLDSRNQSRQNEPPHLLYLAGENPGWPVEMLNADYEKVVRNLGRIRSGTYEHAWKSQTMTEENPIFTNALAQATMGAPYTCFNGGLLQARVRYFDGDRKRPGLPQDVAALVKKLEPGRAVVELVNLSPVSSRNVILQAGAFGEHQFTEVKASGKTVGVDIRCFTVALDPGTAIELDIGMRRFVNCPSYRFPWQETR